jgi:predicted nucleotide-binding protein
MHVVASTGELKMESPRRKRLSALRDELAHLDAEYWSNIESWIAKATPIVKADWPTHFDNFRRIAVAPRPVVSLARSWGQRSATADEDAANKRIAEIAKEKILNFCDGLLTVSDENYSADGNALGNMTAEPGEQPDTMVDTRKVFVAHGRNEAARQALFAFLRAIGLDPLEWSQIIIATGETAPYIGDVLKKGFSIAQAAIVLMTPDDEARLRPAYWNSEEPRYEKEITAQPRQNVLVEAGMAYGLFPGRTVLVELGELRPISDFGGRHKIRMDDSVKTRQELALRLKTAGCNVNIDGTDWHAVGRFQYALAVAKGQEGYLPLTDDEERNFLLGEWFIRSARDAAVNFVWRFSSPDIVEEYKAGIRTTEGKWRLDERCVYIVWDAFQPDNPGKRCWDTLDRPINRTHLRGHNWTEEYRCVIADKLQSPESL